MFFYLCRLLNDFVAQLDRVSASGAEGWGFDSPRGHLAGKHIRKGVLSFFTPFKCLAIPAKQSDAPI